ncbi:FadR family transcriptional regulator [Bacillus canaveralius]|uniref:FadR family transcriptional regulator n=1 Tax=Bacillus canaveralius TaxID=1403243 RepID=A0A2N5GKR6_9BACI|nr:MULTISPECIES: FadR/GntR family transcriptional regulator [Bacillus]PLR82101.1 FadR family transcriptional regulator [Bacillus canaveralius]PLR83929.1 FadR family transcriptional regulator [Bacillus sp. V33-4]PLR97993.1 FadR family transcriptional regulator [Bacillus canaveralius]RSK54426.1 FadR family transcriptional regulator [Bacillus canaveralius]
MNVEKIPTKKVSELVVEGIEKLIDSGEFQAGEKLPSVRELCDLFGVGRSAVRDAITTLKGKGTVFVKQGEGTYICEFETAKLFNHQVAIPSNYEIGKLFEVRKLLEPGIAELAASNRSSENLHKMEDAIFNQAASEWEADYQFHIAIAKSAGNEILIELLQMISATTKKAMIDFHHHIETNPATVIKIKKQHKQIYEAIKAQNRDASNRLMIRHLDFVEHELLKRKFT